MAEYGDYIRSPKERFWGSAFAVGVCGLSATGAFFAARAAWTSHDSEFATIEWGASALCAFFAVLAIWSLSAVNARYTKPKWMEEGG